MNSEHPEEHQGSNEAKGGKADTFGWTIPRTNQARWGQDVANEERPENAADSSGGSWKKPPVHAFFSIILGLIILASLTGVLHKIVLLKEPWELGNRAVGPDGTAATLDPLSSLVRGRLGSSKKASENGPTAPSPSSDGRDEK